MITAAATVPNIRLIAETIIASHTGIAYHAEHNAQGTSPHQGLSSLMCWVRVWSAEHYPWAYCAREDVGRHFLPNRV